MKKFRELSGKLVVAMLAVTLLIGCAIGGTVAWLTATTDAVVNTFTYGNINIELTETKPEGKQAKIIPGVDIEKDPKVTVKANSEACWLFVKVEKTGTFVDGKVTYSIDNGWTKLTGVAGVDNVYYRVVDAVTADTSFEVLMGNKVTVSDTLTKEDIAKLTSKEATLTFTAYAVQKDAAKTAADAWAIANPTTHP